MSGEGASAVEREAELLAEALGRAWGREAGPTDTNETDEANGTPDGRATVASRWIQERGPELLRNLADATALVSDGLRVLADHVEEAGAESRARSAQGEPGERPEGRQEEWPPRPGPWRSPHPQGLGDPQDRQDRHVQERYEEQA
ncbi:hypothetical protein [Mobilicoccus massiliensis]|uniref:hypothetical protein n=1 Tax=Mobilicoccus massiliensis TaxID=1522310 RepID=UPI00058F686B|nr:hypothetical protein [Mobilicoccus massiliensis]